MEIKNAIVHMIRKDRGAPSSIKLRPQELPISGDLIGLVESLRHLYNSTSGHGIGVFKDDVENYPLSLMLADNKESNWNFVDFTNSAMLTLRQRIDAASAATGGYVFFVKYIENQNRYLIIATLKHRGGLGFDDDLNLSPIEHLDLEHLHEMARINLTVWADDTDERYLTFAKKRTDDEFSKYFREFIGCDEFSESRDLTRKLLQSVRHYCEDNSLSEVDRNRIHDSVYAYCEERRSLNQNVSLKALSSRLDEDNPNHFLEYVNSKEAEFKLADGFEPDRSVYRMLRKIRFSDKQISISFNADLWNHRVVYDIERKILTIKDVPGVICEQIGIR